MADSNVQYQLSLKDDLSKGLDQADKHAHRLERSMGSLGERVAHVAEAFGVSFALFKGFEFIKQAKEEFEEIEKANSQLQAGLISTKGAAGLTLSELQAGAKEAAESFNFSKAQVLDMQSVLLTFPSVTKDTFGEASQAIYDISTRMGQDLKSSAVEVGKALQDPIRGMTALRRIGVNFTDGQEAMVKNMIQTGHAAKAQALILHELQTEFAGSAKAAANSDPLFRFNKTMEDVRDTVGHLATDFLKHLTPALEWVSSSFKSATEWAEKHKELMTTVADVLLPVAGAIGAIVVATRAWAIAQWLINAAMLANPIGLIITGIAAAIGVVKALSDHFGGFRAVLFGVWETIKEFGRIVTDVFMGLWHVIHGIFTFSPSEIKLGAKESVDAIANAGHRLGSAFQKGFQEGKDSFAADQKKEHEESLIPKGPVMAAKGAIAGPAAVKEPKTRATGTKAVTINVTIQKLGETHLNITNIKEGLTNLHNAVVGVLTGAVNDFQIVAEH